MLSIGPQGPDIRGGVQGQAGKPGFLHLKQSNQKPVTSPSTQSAQDGEQKSNHNQRPDTRHEVE